MGLQFRFERAQNQRSNPFVLLMVGSHLHRQFGEGGLENIALRLKVAIVSRFYRAPVRSKVGRHVVHKIFQVQLLHRSHTFRVFFKLVHDPAHGIVLKRHRELEERHPIRDGPQSKGGSGGLLFRLERRQGLHHAVVHALFDVTDHPVEGREDRVGGVVKDEGRQLAAGIQAGADGHDRRKRSLHVGMERLGGVFVGVDVGEGLRHAALADNGQAGQRNHARTSKPHNLHNSPTCQRPSRIKDAPGSVSCESIPPPGPSSSRARRPRVCLLRINPAPGSVFLAPNLPFHENGCYASRGGHTLALPAHPLSYGPPALDVEEVLKRLPAQARAHIAWTQKPIQEGLARLRKEPLTDDLLAAVVEQVIVPFRAMGRVVWESLAANRDELRALTMQDFSTREECLIAFLSWEDARDTLAWVVGLLRSFYEFSFNSFTPGQAARLDDGAWQEVTVDSNARALVAGLFCFMAAADEARLGTERERAHDLLDVAFLELTKLRDAAREFGVWLSAFPFETLSQRRVHLLRDADKLRQVLSDDDWATMEQARMRDLR